jgi:CHAT domain-containing protein/tetratricopeptide (TPR) repeat protein
MLPRTKAHRGHPGLSARELLVTVSIAVSVCFLAGMNCYASQSQSGASAVVPATIPKNDKNNDRAEATRLYAEADGLYRQGAYDKAQQAAESALQAGHETSACLVLLGRIADGKDNFARGAGLYTQALATSEKAFGSNSLETAEALDGQARNFTATANYPDAEAAGKQALHIREEKLQPNDILIAQSLETLASLYKEKSDLAGAASMAGKALEIVQKTSNPDDLAYADAESTLGRIEIARTNFARAEELLTHASKVKKTVGGESSLLYADSLADLGTLNVFKLDFVHAEEFLVQAQERMEKLLGPDHLKVALVLHNRANIANRRRDYGTAEKFYLRALSIKEKVLGQDHPSVGATLNNLGIFYWARNEDSKADEYRKAEEYFLRAEAIFEKFNGPESTPVAQTLSNLAVVVKSAGDYKSAEEYFKRALPILEKLNGPNHMTVAGASDGLGILYADDGDYAKAEPLLLRELQITRDVRGPEHPDAGRILRVLSKMYTGAGNTARARECWRQSLAIEEKDLPLSLAIGSERQKADFWVPYMAYMEQVISFQMLHDPESSESREMAAEALLQRKGRVLDALANNVESLRGRLSAEDQALLDRLKDTTSKLANLVLSGPGKTPLSEHQQQVKTLTEQREALENEIGRRSAGYFQSSAAITLKEIQAAIPAGDALVEYGLYEPYDVKQPLESTKASGPFRYVAYVITSHAVRSVDLGDAKTIDAAISALRKSLRDPQSRDIKVVARAVDEKIMRPVRALAADARHLLIAPDGELDLIPFEALVDENGNYLVERNLFTYLSTGRDLLRMRTPRTGRTEVAVVAAPSFGELNTLAVSTAPQAHPTTRSISPGSDSSSIYFAPLEGTKAEAQEIRALFPQAEVFTGAQATKATLLGLNAPGILHIATHGFFLDDATKYKAGDSANDTRKYDPWNPLLRSGLALAGANLNRRGGDSGILTALEASNLNLWGTKLVTLSACDTGIGEVRVGEGVFGLRRAFVLAGSESLVMSLWPVSDYTTREMITNYYTGLKNGRGRGEALRQAELSVLKRKGREHPFYWASFIESGEWANLSGQR